MTEKPKALTADVGLIRVVMRRGTLSNHADECIRRLQGSEARAGPFGKRCGSLHLPFRAMQPLLFDRKTVISQNLYSDSKSSIDIFLPATGANCLSNASRVLFINESIFFVVRR
ncbi:MAG: hypothetical protein R3F44_11025 [Candidatus Competibacteraceae bacterium]